MKIQSLIQLSRCRDRHWLADTRSPQVMIASTPSTTQKRSGLKPRLLLASAITVFLASPAIAQSSAHLGIQTGADAFLISQAIGGSLQEGDSGAAVTELQERLAALGYYNGPISGYFGEQTAAAVIEFQVSQGLMADGVVGVSTEAALFGSAASADPGVVGGALRLGSSGNAVTSLQEQLAALGFYNGPISGYFGSLTEAAVMDFQSSQGLLADGIVGGATESALYGGGSSSVGSPVVRQGATGDLVIALQQRLAELGYYMGAIDGDFGRSTLDAVLWFQDANGLVADGVVGPSTEAALRDPGAVAAGATSRPTPRPTPPAIANDPDPDPTPSNRPTSTDDPRLLELGDSGRAIIALQSQLRALGFFDSPIDGNFGDTTETAVMDFQRSQRLITDGIAGPQTLAKLDEEFFALEEPDTPNSSSNTTTPNATQQGITGFPPPSIPGGVVVQPSPPTINPSPAPVVTVPSVPNPNAQPQQIPQTTQSPVFVNNTQAFDDGSFTVLDLQRRLRARGLYQGSLDGTMNPLTQQAINDAQRVYGLSIEDLMR